LKGFRVSVGGLRTALFAKRPYGFCCLEGEGVLPET
jgi:hypothetical protein